VLGKVLRYVFAICDAVLGFWTAVEGVVGFEESRAFLGPTVGISLVVFGLALFVSAFAVVTGLSWRKPLRTGLYAVLFIAITAAVIIYPQDWWAVLAWALVLIANLPGYLVWEWWFASKRTAETASRRSDSA
jgi:predicted MFS family arabinose efflux permease